MTTPNSENGSESPQTALPTNPDERLDLWLATPKGGIVAGWVRTENGWRKGDGRQWQTTGDRLWADRTNVGMDLLPEEATSQRIAFENEQAHRHGTGAVYDSQGHYHNSSRAGEAREMRRRGRQNNDGGAKDYTGPSRTDSLGQEYRAMVHRLFRQ